MKKEIIGGEIIRNLSNLEIPVKIGTIDKNKMSSVYLEWGLWITPLNTNIIKLCRVLDHHMRIVMRDIVKDNCGDGCSVLFNLEYPQTEHLQDVGINSYVRFEIMILFPDGVGYNYKDLRFEEMGEDLINWLVGRDDMECYKYRLTRKVKGTV
jgi:hypothetical protein